MNILDMKFYGLKCKSINVEGRRQIKEVKRLEEKEKGSILIDFGRKIA